MSLVIPQPVLKGRKARVVGVANNSSIAYGCARAFHELGADLAVTYLNEKARPHVEPVVAELAPSIFMPLDVSVPGELETLFGAIERDWGHLDILVHAMSPGPLKTRAASGLKDFDLLLAEAAQKAPLGEGVDIMDVGFTCAYLATPYARRVSGGTIYVDGGVNIMA
ncbi:MAG TPA: SDR family oxidoreductase [Rubrivivax sp.]|nr:SDR family oxidoreductase [Rubrivivax sp.]